ncbi:hypothetical protein L596_003148 [Steinernema carpocapsae]|uniref:Uncharacterized protein n=1 Tax=Steinernema carpocapsae TaxID=34508 RepID=A0A4U8URK3_STECR|nr:hypothetical protein L596_003148 [Steinernema carpocapsae]
MTRLAEVSPDEGVFLDTTEALSCKPKVSESRGITSFKLGRLLTKTNEEDAAKELSLFEKTAITVSAAR